MNHTRPIVIAFLGLSALAWYSIPREPRFDGKPLGEWMHSIGYGQVVDGRRQLDDDIGWVMPFRETTPAGRNPREIDQAHAALQHLGTDAIPFLKPMLLAQDSDLRNRIDPTFQHFPKLAKYFPTPQQRRQRAMAALHCMGESAVPFLIQVFQNERTPADVRTFAAYTFLGFPKRSAGAVPALKRARDTADPLLAYIAGEALKSVETGATDSERLEDQRD